MLQATIKELKNWSSAANSCIPKSFRNVVGNNVIKEVKENVFLELTGNICDDLGVEIW